MLADQWGDDVERFLSAHDSWMSHFFGEHGDKKLSYDDFKNLLYVTDIPIRK